MSPPRLAVPILILLTLFALHTSAQDRPLKPGERVEIELRPGDSAAFRLTLTPLDFVRVQINPRNQELVVKVITPAGKELSVRRFPRDADAIPLPFVAGYTGEFRLVIASREKAPPAEKIEIHFAEQRMVAPPDGERIAAEDAYAEGERHRAHEVNEERRPAIAQYEEALSRWRALGDREGEGRARHALGRVHGDLNLDDRAFDWFTQALAIRRELKDRAGEAASLSNIAGIHNNRNERQQAIALHQQALAIRRELGDRRGEAASLQNLGLVYRGLNQRDKALEFFQQALQLRREVRDRRGEAASLAESGAMFRQMGQYEKAFDSYQQAAAIYQSLEDKRGLAVIETSLGAFFLSQGKRREALVHLERALETQHALGARRAEANTLNQIASTYNELGDRPRALDYFNRGLQTSREINDPPGVARSLLGLGEYHRSLGDNRRALEFYEQARPLRRGLGLAEVLNNAGLAHHEMGERQTALDSYQEALALLKQANSPDGQAAVLGNIGLVYNSIGERRLALDYFNQALEIRRKLRNPLEEANLLTSIGGVLNALEERPKAIEHLDQALRLAQGDRSMTAIALNAKAIVHLDLKEYPAALDLLNQALPLARAIKARSLEAETLHDIGWVHRMMNDLASARDHLNQSLEIHRAAGKRLNEASTLFALAHVEHDAGESAAARSRIEAAIEVAESLRAGLGSAEMRASYFASVQKYYDLYIEILMKAAARDRESGLEAEALRVSERARARSLLDLLNESGADIRQGADPALIARERDLQQQLNARAARATQLRLGRKPAGEIEAIEAEINRLNAEYQNLQASLRAGSPRYAALTQPQTLTVKEIQEQVLDRDTMLLEYALGEKQSYLWAVTTARLRSFELPNRETIEEAARDVLEQLTARNRGEAGEADAQRDRRVAQADARLDAATARLSRMLLGPVARQLGAKRLLIVAQGALQYIPFGALPEPRIQRRPPASRKSAQPAAAHQPLLARHEILNLPSVSTLAALRREIAGRPPAEKMLAVFADPVFEKDDERVLKIAVKPQAPAQAPAAGATRLLKHASDRFPTRIPRLRFTRREADSILAFVPEGERRAALDFRASRAAVSDPELARYRYVHFATHGMLDSQTPELSSLVLSLVDERGTQQDGFLRAMDVYNLNLPAELVVLSACETGLGKQVRGEGLVGLTRGFMYAGAPRVIVSLWAVNDEATAELMARLYRKMIRENLRPAAALRAAQLEMLRETKWRAPYFWAAFSVQGEWRQP
jgi:tetratricopeptide (TPR) repeat protein